MKTVVIAKTKGGYTHTFFCPNEDIHKLVGEEIRDKELSLVGLRSLTDKEYFHLKFNKRVEELENTIEAFDRLGSVCDDDTKDYLRGVLLDNIFAQIGVISGMLRRNYKRHYGYDDSHVTEVLNKWEERRDY